MQKVRKISERSMPIERGDKLKKTKGKHISITTRYRRLGFIMRAFCEKERLGIHVLREGGRSFLKSGAHDAHLVLQEKGKLLEGRKKKWKNGKL